MARPCSITTVSGVNALAVKGALTSALMGRVDTYNPQVRQTAVRSLEVTIEQDGVPGWGYEGQGHLALITELLKEIVEQTPDVMIDEITLSHRRTVGDFAFIGKPALTQ